jgi:hypothetical protein
MRRFNPRLIIGGLLIFGGLLGLLEATGVIKDVGSIFWGVVWGLFAAVFFFLLFNGHQNWWAAFPAFTLLGMAVASFLPESRFALDAAVFFAGISLAFWWVYLTDTSRWWAIIPGGVMLTLGAVSALEHRIFLDTGGIFFIGLGLTFLLVAILPGGSQRRWAFIPATFLLISGTLFIQSPGLVSYVGPAMLIITGGYLVFMFMKKN